MKTIDPNTRAHWRGEAEQVESVGDMQRWASRMCRALDALEATEAELADLRERLTAQADRYDATAAKAVTAPVQEFLPEFARVLRNLAVVRDA